MDPTVVHQRSVDPTVRSGCSPNSITSASLSVTSSSALAGRNEAWQWRWQYPQLWNGWQASGIFLQVEQMIAPWRQIEVESARVEIIAVSFILRIAQQVFQSPLAVFEICKRKPDVALALVSGVTYRPQQPIFAASLPTRRDETIGGPVAVPGGDTFEQTPVAIPQRRRAQRREQTLVEILDRANDRILRSAHQVL